MTPPEEYCLIPLTQGQFAKVSPHRFDELSQLSWHAHWNNCTHSFYARRNARVCGKHQSIWMHREILGLKAGCALQGDHINRDTLDNQDGNLRACTKLENSNNKGSYRNNTSGLKGVYFAKRWSRWEARIRSNGKMVQIGSFETAELAHAAYLSHVSGRQQISAGPLPADQLVGES